jgi:hypothetical protein
VVKEIKSNQQLEHDLDQMDVKIGLLIKNRITLQVSEKRNLASWYGNPFDSVWGRL